MKLKVDPASFTIAELVELERVAGRPFAQIATSGQIDARDMLAIVLIVGRRDNPDFTEDDAGQVRVRELEWAEPDPTDAGASSKSPASPTSGE